MSSRVVGCGPAALHHLPPPHNHQEARKPEMTGFIVRRLFSAALVVVLTSLFVFVLFFKGLGTAPAVNYCEKLGPGKCTPDKLASIEKQMGFDKSVMANYAEWAKGIFVGRSSVYVDGKTYDCPAPCLGISIMTGDTVWTDLK